MRKIKIKYLDWWNGFNPKTYLINQILEKHYEVEVSDNPDYVFCSVYSKDFLEYDCVRILYTAENFCPDFNLFDYAIGFDRLSFEDRYIWFPNYLMNPKYEKDLELLKCKHTDEQIEKKPKSEFCSFVVSNGVGSQMRVRFFELLNHYKTVNSGGKYLNNIGLPQGVDDKFDFQVKHKFSIAFENSSHRGYCTEKIVEAFAAGTIPIYWGDPCVTEIFNERAMVIVKDEIHFEEAIEQIIEINENDNLYMQMLREPALVNQNFFEESYKDIEKFLCSIIETPLPEARKRTEIPLAKSYYKNFEEDGDSKRAKEGRKWFIFSKKFI